MWDNFIFQNKKRLFYLSIFQKRKKLINARLECVNPEQLNYDILAQMT
jgi:hypothetical protein